MFQLTKFQAINRVLRREDLSEMLRLRLIDLINNALNESEIKSMKRKAYKMKDAICKSYQLEKILGYTFHIFTFELSGSKIRSLGTSKHTFEIGKTYQGTIGRDVLSKRSFVVADLTSQPHADLQGYF